MRFNFINTSEFYKRFRLRPLNGATAVLPDPPTNPTLGLDEDTGEVTFCLAPPSFSCDGATETSGWLQGEGFVDVYVDGERVALNVAINQIDQVLTGEYMGVAAVAIESEFSTVAAMQETASDLAPPEPWWVNDPEYPNNQNFGADHVWFILEANASHFDKSMHSDVYLRTTDSDQLYHIEIPATFPREELWQQGYDAYDIDLLMHWIDVWIEGPDEAWYVEVYAVWNPVTSKYGYMFNVINHNNEPVTMTFFVANRESNVQLPVNAGWIEPFDAGFEQFVTEFVEPTDATGDPRIIHVYLGDADIEQLLEAPPPPPAPPPVLTPPDGVLDWIILKDLDHYTLEINGEPVIVQSSKTIGDDYRIDNNTILLLQAMRNVVEIQSHSLSSGTRNYAYVFIKNLSDEYLHFKLTSNAYTVNSRVVEHHESENHSLERGINGDRDVYTFWLGPRPEEEVLEESEFDEEAPNNRIKFTIPKLNLPPEDPISFKDYIVVEYNGRVLTFPHGLTRDAQEWGNVSTYPFFVDPRHYLTPDGFHDYAIENLADEVANVKIYPLLGDATRIINLFWNTDFVRYRDRLEFTLSERNLTVDIIDKPGFPISDHSVSLMVEFYRKYPLYLDHDMEVTFNLGKELVPKVKQLGHQIAYELTATKTNTHIYPQGGVRDRISAIFIANTPLMRVTDADPDEIKYIHWNYFQIPGVYGLSTVKWTRNVTVNLHIYKPAYGMGGNGGWYRKLDTSISWYADGVPTGNGGKGYPAIYNHCTPEEVTLRVETHMLDGGYLYGGGGGSRASNLEYHRHGGASISMRSRPHTDADWGNWSSWSDMDEWYYGYRNERMGSVGGGGGRPYGWVGNSNELANPYSINDFHSLTIHTITQGAQATKDASIYHRTVRPPFSATHQVFQSSAEYPNGRWVNAPLWYKDPGAYMESHHLAHSASSLSGGLAGNDAPFPSDITDFKMTLYPMRAARSGSLAQDRIRDNRSPITFTVANYFAGGGAGKIVEGHVEKVIGEYMIMGDEVIYNIHGDIRDISGVLEFRHAGGGDYVDQIEIEPILIPIPKVPGLSVQLSNQIQFIYSLMGSDISDIVDMTTVGDNLEIIYVGRDFTGVPRWPVHEENHNQKRKWFKQYVFARLRNEVESLDQEIQDYIEVLNERVTHPYHWPFNLVGYKQPSWTNLPPHTYRITPEDYVNTMDALIGEEYRAAVQSIYDAYENHPTKKVDIMERYLGDHSLIVIGLASDK